MSKSRDLRIGLLFASPWIIGFCVFLLYPVVASLRYSFTSYSVLNPPRYIGLANYQELAGDSVFWGTMKNTLLYLIGAVPLMTVVAIGLALLLNTKVKGMAFYRAMFFMPSLVPMVAQGTLFLWIFNGDYGVLNTPFRKLGLTPPNWLGDPTWTKWTLVLIAIWGCGQAMILYLAGLQDVPASLYEASELDGAGLWQKTKNVTLPMLSPVILFNVIMGIIGAIQLFAVPYVMFPDGQPARSTYFVTSYLYDNAFNYQRMGYASAIAWVMFVVTLILTLFAIRFSDRHVHYGSN
ncbi:MAG TPA: sugar ABC transporter permease [Fimbriimonadaceae bacterium]